MRSSFLIRIRNGLSPEKSIFWYFLFYVELFCFGYNSLVNGSLMICRCGRSKRLKVSQSATVVCFVFCLFEIEEKHDHFTFLNIVMTVKRFE